MAIKERVSLTIDPELIARIDAVSTARQESRSSAVERILRNGIEDEEDILGSLGEGIEGRVIAYLLKSPKTLRRLAKMVGEELTPETLARVESEGPGVIDAGRRFRNVKKSSTKGDNA